VDAERAGDVVRRRHDAAAVWIAADHEWLVTELGTLELLDCGEECVEVEVGQDGHVCRRHRRKASDV
jgi:hypothetical protein